MTEFPVVLLNQCCFSSDVTSDLIKYVPQTAPKCSCVLKRLCWGSPVQSSWGGFAPAEVLVRGWILGALHRGAWSAVMIPNHLWQAYEGYGCLITGICVEEVQWVSSMSSTVRGACEPNSQTLVSCGLCSPQMAMWVRPSGQKLAVGFPNQFSTSVWKTGYYQTHRGIADSNG